MGRTSRCLAGALVVLASAPVRAGESTPPVSAEVVRLDVVVTDERGRPVPDLTHQDFEVFEDGKRQRLSSSVFLGRASAVLSPAAPGEEAAATRFPEATGRQQSRRARRIAIVIDEPHLSRRGIVAVKEALRRFLTETVAPDDEVAWIVVGSPAGTVQPTRDRASLRRAVERIHARRESILTGQGAQLTPEQSEQILRGDPFALRLAARLWMEEPGSPYSGRFVPKNVASGPVPAGLDPSEKGAAIDAERLARRVLAEALAASETSLHTVERVLQTLGRFPGRKLCLFVSDGFLVGRGTSEERTYPLQRVIDAATRSGAAVYPLLAGGLAPTGADAAAVGGAGPAGLRDRVSRVSEQQRLETLEDLADDTGGLLVRGADAVDTDLARMLEDDAAVYLLAYEPVNKKRDGRFRRLTVRMPRHPDYVVRARKGYFAPDARKAAGHDPVALSLPPSMAEAERALAVPPPAEGAALHVAADYVEEPLQGPRAIVKAHLDPAELPWRDVAGRKSSLVDLVGGVFDREGRPTGPPFAIRRYDFDLTQAEYETLRASGVRFAAAVPVEPGAYELRMLALDEAQLPLAGARVPLEVPDLALRTLTLSGIFLSATDAESERPELRDKQALRRFDKDDTLVYHVFVYNVARDPEGKSDVVLQAQVRPGEGPPFASRPRPALLREREGVLLPEGSGIPLAAVGPGRFELRIVAVDRKAGATAARSVDFTVE